MDEAEQRILQIVDSAPDDWPGAPLSWFPLQGGALGKLIESGIVEAVDAPDPLPRKYPATNPDRLRSFIRRKAQGPR